MELSKEQFRAIRKALKLRQEDLGRQLGYGSRAQVTVSNIEKGNDDAPITDRTKLALARLIRDGEMSLKEADRIIAEYLKKNPA